MLKKLFTKDFFKKYLSRNPYRPLINQINALENDLKLLTDNELRDKNLKLQKQYASEQNLNTLISQSFALTREASIRTLGLRHFDVQLLGGLVLNDNKIGEMQTGEGKTLVATLPASLNAITKKGVHIITVNDYLANRDQISMGQIYRFLGFDTGLIQNQMSKTEKRENYNADLTYATNYDVAFDFLYDNLALYLGETVHRPFNYCIIDEVDSILIDEGNTPLVIANPIKTETEKHIIAVEITKFLTLNTHYIVNEKNKSVTLNENGNKQIEQILSIQGLYDGKDPWIPYVVSALQAKTLYFRNVHYILENQQVVMVDEFTGRRMPDRRWGNGLHQALEAKEKVTVRQETETVAEITYQNFFLLYPKLSGMTGTGKTVEGEFQEIYNLSVKKVPTAKPNQRKDLPDLVFKDQFLKWNAIAKECKEMYLKGQPVLIGTKTIEKSEMLAQLLSEYKLSYQILNAKPENARKEAEIVAQAGRKSTITIATNMAGRGTDIILGGNTDFRSQKKLYKILISSQKYTSPEFMIESSFLDSLKGVSQKFVSVLLSLISDSYFATLLDTELLQMIRENNVLPIPITFCQHSIKLLMNELIEYYKKQQKQEHVLVKNLGGLYIIGTERNDSSRVDNQLRGRCGRQGDPGISRFFLSLDDKLLRLFTSSKVQTFLKMKIFHDSGLESSLLTRTLNSAQTKLEERASQQRKNLFDYDKILNKQRNFIYELRRGILRIPSIQPITLIIVKQALKDLAQKLVDNNSETLSSETLLSIISLENLFGKKLLIEDFLNANLSVKKSNLWVELHAYLIYEFRMTYLARKVEFTVYGPKNFNAFQRTLILRNMDKIWREHLQELTLLKDAVRWRSYGQRKPLDEYKQDAFQIFEKKIKSLPHLVLYDFLRLPSQ